MKLCIVFTHVYCKTGVRLITVPYIFVNLSAGLSVDSDCNLGEKRGAAIVAQYQKFLACNH